MNLQDMKKLGSMISLFLSCFADCFRGLPARKLFATYVKGQLSDTQRKTCEAIALKFNVVPRTLQRFLESIKWDEKLVRDRCLEIVARDHAHPEAIGLIDESGITKSGKCTTAVSRQYNGNRGKVENAVVGVHLAYAMPGFRTILDSQLYLPREWADDPARRKKTTFQKTSSFKRSRKSLWNSSVERLAKAFA
jgi:SRSO17 transposase